MNAEQLSTWKEIVRECKPGAYTRANAAQARCDAITAVNALVELVTPGLAALLERLVDVAEGWTNDARQGLELAARIREALEENSD